MLRAHASGIAHGVCMILPAEEGDWINGPVNEQADCCVQGAIAMHLLFGTKSQTPKSAEMLTAASPQR